jgi:hypothetical protein
MPESGGTSGAAVLAAGRPRCGDHGDRQTERALHAVRQVLMEPPRHTAWQGRDDDLVELTSAQCVADSIQSVRACNLAATDGRAHLTQSVEAILQSLLCARIFPTGKKDITCLPRHTPPGHALGGRVHRATSRRRDGRNEQSEFARPLGDACLDRVEQPIPNQCSVCYDKNAPHRPHPALAPSSLSPTLTLRSAASDRMSIGRTTGAVSPVDAPSQSLACRLLTCCSRPTLRQDVRIGRPAPTSLMRGADQVPGYEERS